MTKTTAIVLFLGMMALVTTVSFLERLGDSGEYRRCREYLRTFGGYDDAPEICSMIVYGTEYSLPFIR